MKTTKLTRFSQAINNWTNPSQLLHYQQIRQMISKKTEMSYHNNQKKTQCESFLSTVRLQFC